MSEWNWPKSVLGGEGMGGGGRSSYFWLDELIASTAEAISSFSCFYSEGGEQGSPVD